MAWMQLMFETSPAIAEALGEALHAAGAAAVTLRDAGDEPIFEPGLGQSPLWQSTHVVGLFEAGADLSAVVQSLEQELAPEGLPLYEIQPLADQDWERVWLRDFRPMPFGARLWIVPTVFEPPHADAVNVMLDPGLAFGTGTHPTTGLCLQWLDGHIAGGETLLDFGCGSGILAVAALKLGAASAMATDIDPQALRATQDNAAKNHVLNSIHTCLPRDLPPKRYDIVVANILANPLIELAAILSDHVKDGGRLVLSGLLTAHVEAVAAAYHPLIAWGPPQTKEQWALLAGTKRPMAAGAQG